MPNYPNTLRNELLWRTRSQIKARLKYERLAGFTSSIRSTYPSLRQLRLLTRIWTNVELFVVFISAVRADDSAAVAIFAGHSAIESLFALVVFLEFRSGLDAEHKTAQSSAILL